MLRPPFEPGVTDDFDYDDSGCWVKRQPVTDIDHDQMKRVLEGQELGCIRYSGSDPVSVRLTRVK